jgi:hypothetical protein
MKKGTTEINPSVAENGLGVLDGSRKRTIFSGVTNNSRFGHLGKQESTASEVQTKRCNMGVHKVPEIRCEDGDGVRLTSFAGLVIFQ